MTTIGPEGQSPDLVQDTEIDPRLQAALELLYPGREITDEEAKRIAKLAVEAAAQSTKEQA